MPYPVTDGQLCPLILDECQPNCQWADNVTRITEDGFERATICAVTRIAAALMAWHYSRDDDGWVWDD